MTIEQKNHILENLEDIISILEEPSEFSFRRKVAMYRVKMIIELVKSYENQS